MRSLQAMPPASRQGAVGAVVYEALHKHGRFGKPCELGVLLKERLLGGGEEGEEDGDGDGDGADATMIYPDGQTLRLHRVLLAARAPDWLRALDRETGEWRLNEEEAAALPRVVCAILYELVVTGHVDTLADSHWPSGLTSDARLFLPAAERLGIRRLISAPPTDRYGTPWLAIHLSSLVRSTRVGGRTEAECFERRHSLQSIATIRFDLKDGASLHAHAPLLAAGSEYFRTMLRFAHRNAEEEDGGGEKKTAAVHVVRVDDVGEAPFCVLLRYVYTGLLPAVTKRGQTSGVVEVSEAAPPSDEPPTGPFGRLWL